MTLNNLAAQKTSSDSATLSEEVRDAELEAAQSTIFNEHDRVMKGPISIHVVSSSDQFSNPSNNNLQCDEQLADDLD